MTYRKNPEPEVVQLPFSGGPNNVLSLLESQIKNYPSMFAFYTKNIYTPSVVLVPQTLKLIDGEMTRNSTFLYEALTFLDAITLFSLQETGGPMDFFNSVVSGLMETRTVNDEKLLLSANEMSNVIYNNANDIQSLLVNNKILVSIYVFCMVCSIFYIKEI